MERKLQAACKRFALRDAQLQDAKAAVIACLREWSAFTSQVEVARALGFSKPYISDVINGNRGISLVLVNRCLETHK